MCPGIFLSGNPHKLYFGKIGPGKATTKGKKKNQPKHFVEGVQNRGSGSYFFQKNLPTTCSACANILVVIVAIVCVFSIQTQKNVNRIQIHINYVPSAGDHLDPWKKKKNCGNSILEVARLNSLFFFCFVLGLLLLHWVSF